ncbi:hypothetical protein V7S43_008519 [Phytophthora oleae]|uniref:HAT C-terminal dimerisation domain-containing protein n=1 Tax=Phytophthora oleae TaxID=2107226 RepID=A0ABD3FHM2_9STRA
MEMEKVSGKPRRLEDDVIERNQSIVKATVKQKLLPIMRDLAPLSTGQDSVASRQRQSVTTSAFTEDVSELFTNGQSTAPAQATPGSLHEDVIDADLERWFRDPSLLQPAEDGLESVLLFWKRQSKSTAYRFLSSVARIIFACPTRLRDQSEDGHILS